MKTNINSELNCLLEEVTLTLDISTNTVITPMGKANASVGFFSHNHVTIIWDRLIAKKKEEEKHLIASGKGELH